MRMLKFRRSISALSCMAILLSTVVLPSSNLKASSTESITPDDSHELIRTLSEKFERPEGATHPLDYFHLLDQVVTDHNEVKVDSLKAKEKSINDFLTIIEELEKRIDATEYSTITRIATAIKFVKENSLSTLDEEEMVKNAGYFFSKKYKADKSEITNLASGLDKIETAPFNEALKEFNQEDYIEDFEDFIAGAKANKNYRSNLKLKFSDEEEVLSQTDFLSEDQLQFGQEITINRDLDFQLANKNGEALHDMKMKVSFAQFFGDYLVFVKQSEAQKADGVMDVHYIDLKTFKTNIGNSSLPIFKFPVHINGPLESAMIKNGALVLNDKAKITLNGFNSLSKIHQVTFNISVGLLDPNTYTRSKQILEEASNFFDQAIKEQGKVFENSFEAVLDNDETLNPKEGLRNEQVSALKDQSDIIALVKEIEEMGGTHPYVETLKNSGQAMMMTKTAHATSRKFLTRVHLLMAEISMPRLQGVKILLSSLAKLASKDADQRAAARGVIASSKLVKFVKYGTIATAAAIVGHNLPTEIHNVMLDGLEIGKNIASSVHGYFQHTGYGLNFLDLLNKAKDVAVSGPMSVPDAYFAADKLPKFLIGLSSVITLPFITFAIPHVLTNMTLALKKVLIENWRGLRETTSGKMTFLKDAFIAHMNNLKKNYDDAISSAESAKTGAKVELTKEEEAELNKIIGDVKRKVKKNNKAVETAAESSREVKTFGKAMMNFMFSYPALTQTYTFLATVWNYFYISRSFIWKPSTWVLPFIYPNYLKIATRDIKSNVHYPSDFNGGTDSIIDVLKNKTVSKDRLELIKRYETAAIEIEKVVQELATQKALMALIKRTTDVKRLNSFFDSISGSIGLSGLDDPKLQELKGQDKAFFRAYFTNTFDSVMSKYITTLQGKELKDLEGFQVELNNFKNETLSATEAMEEVAKKSQSEIRKEVEKVYESLDQEELIKTSESIATELGQAFNKGKINYRHKLFKSITPKNAQLNRFLVVREKLKDPKAVARAVRSEIASLLVSKPLQLLGIFAMFAGVTEGVLMPLQEEMFGPNSIFYMSRQLFYNGFVAGTIISIMADTWYKIQVDNRIDSSGGFDSVPSKLDQARGFWRYYFKNLSNPNNGWWANQSMMMKLVWANMPAALITFAITQFTALGRFDIGIFLSSYILYFTTPMSGINTKIEQAFELASSWVSSKIPKKYRASAKAQEYINIEIQKKKFQFNIFHQTYEIVIGHMMEIFELMSTKEYGSRSFLRLIFFGYTPTELAALGLRKTNDIFGFIPGVDFITNKCEDLLTNNYTDWSKVSPRVKE